LNILYDYMPCEIDSSILKKYDLVFFCNGGEPMSVASDGMKKIFDNPKVYYIANSYLNTAHHAYGKIIWFPSDLMFCRDFWCRHFYPQFFESAKNKQLPLIGNLIGINGANRANRHYFFSQLNQAIPSLPVMNNYGTWPRKLIDASFESIDDINFREYVNELYKGSADYGIEHSPGYYENSVCVGINQKFGKISPGYFILPEYYQYRVVIFPESNWQNNELAMTEKAFKCFFAGSLPFPIGGASINQLYNQVGFATAWNLLPTDLQQFDSIENHVERQHKIIQSIQWLNDNPWVFSTDKFNELVDKNRITFLTVDCQQKSVQQLYQLIKDKL
jgi:hypothetical protein